MTITQQTIAYLIGGIVIGLVIGFFLAKHYFEKQLKENPPINEKMIRAMYNQMGRKPKEADIKAIMKTFNQK